MTPRFRRYWLAVLSLQRAELRLPPFWLARARRLALVDFLRLKVRLRRVLVLQLVQLLRLACWLTRLRHT